MTTVPTEPHQALRQHQTTHPNGRHPVSALTWPDRTTSPLTTRHPRSADYLLHALPSHSDLPTPDRPAPTTSPPFSRQTSRLLVPAAFPPTTTCPRNPRRPPRHASPVTHRADPNDTTDDYSRRHVLRPVLANRLPDTCHTAATSPRASIAPRPQRLPPATRYLTRPTTDRC